jgi:hypothetical protein
VVVLAALFLSMSVAPRASFAQLFGGPGGLPGGGGGGRASQKKAQAPQDPNAPELHAASGSEQSQLPKTELTLPEDPNEIPPQVKKTIGADTADDEYAQGTDRKTEIDFYGPYYSERSGKYRFRTAFPFWFERTQPGDRASLFGPYYNRRSKHADADVAFPFYWHFRTEQNYTTIVPPFYHQESKGSKTERPTHANWLPPLFFEGTTKDGGGYFHIPPLLTFTSHSDRDGLNIVGPMFCKWKGGASCDVRTAEEIDLGLAPFYFYGRDHESEYEVIPPLLHYYHYSDVGDSETNLWGPLLWQRDRKGKVFDILPLFWRNWGRNEDHITFFPFFHYGYEGTSHLLVTPLFVEARGLHDERTFATWGYARYRGRTELDMVTPLFWWYRDPDLGLDTKMLLPFFYKSKSPKNDDLLIFPFYASFNRPGVSHTTWVTPLFQHNTSVEGWFTNIYPIFFMGRDNRSTHLVAAPVLWDFASPKSRTTVVFPVMFRYSDTQTVSQLTLNTYYHETKVRGGSEWEFHFFPVFSYGESPTGHWWNILYGLAGYTRDGTMSKMRALYIPIKLSE